MTELESELAKPLKETFFIHRFQGDTDPAGHYIVVMYQSFHIYQPREINELGKTKVKRMNLK